MVKNPPANAGGIRDMGSTPRLGDPLEKGTATHTSILAWRIPWTEEPGRLWSRGPQRVGCNWSNLPCIGEGNGNQLQYSCLENPTDGGAWWATVHGVAKSQKQLSDFTLIPTLQGMPGIRTDMRLLAELLSNHPESL